MDTGNRQCQIGGSFFVKATETAIWQYWQLGVRRGQSLKGMEKNGLTPKYKKE